MKNLNLFRKSARGSEGSTLASTVVRPSFDRRNWRLKHIAFMLLFLLGGFGQMWGGEATITFADLNLKNQQQYSDPFNIDANVTITFAGGANDGKYYDTGAGIRTYGGGTITIDAGSYTISEAAFTWDGSNKPGADNANPEGYSTTTGKWTGNASSFVLTRPTGSGHWRLKSVTVTYSGSAQPTVLKSIAVSGDLTNKNYETTDALNLAGLTVTGSYDDDSEKEITSGITWKVRTNSTSEAVNLDAYTLTAGQTSVEVQATVNEVSSDWKTITGLTVTAASPKITITQNEVADFAASYAEYTWTAGGVSGKLYAYKNAGMQFNPNKTGYYVYNTDPIPGRITKITMTKASGTDRSWTPYVSTTAMTSASGTALDAKSVTTSGASWDVTGSNRYFYLTVAGGSTVIGSIVIEYTEEAPPAVEVPSISGDENFVTSTTVTISHADADHIYYTTNGDAPTTSSAEYTAPFSLTNTATVKAIAVKGSDVSAVAEKTFTKATVMTVAEALATATGNDKYVKGIIASIEEVSTEHGNATYNLKDEGQTNSIKIYRGKYLNNVNFTAADQIIVGDEVTVFGTVSQYQSVNQFAQGNYIVAIKPAARLAWSAESYDAELGGSNSFPALTNTNSVAITYSSSDENVATIAANGEITLNAVGTTTITAAFAGNENYKANSASYELNVAAAVIRADISFNVDGGSAVEALTDQSALPNPLPTTTKAGKNFGGWYTDAEKTVAAVAGAAVTSTDAITLYAKWLDPYTVAEARAAIDASEGVTGVYATGIVSEIVTAYNSQYGNISYNISSDGTTTADQLQAFRGKAANGANFNSASDVQVGDVVVVYGNLTKHNDIYEFAADNQLYSLSRPEVAVTSVELDQSTASIEVGETVTLHATVNPDKASNKAITWTVESGDTYASVDGGVVTGLVAGEAVIRATSNADNTKYAECTVTVTAADPTKHVVTFDATVDKGESPLSKSNITLSCSNGALNNGTEYRLYKNSTTTLACSAGNITKIEFTGVSGNPVSGFGAPEVGTLVTDGDDGVWTGNAASITFTASGAQVRAKEIKVTYKEDNRAEAGLAYETTAIDKHVGDEAFVNALTNPNNLTVAYESSNTDVAEVANDGTVTIKAEGSATITASFDGDADYKPASVSYELTVNEAGLDNVTFNSSIDLAASGETTISKGGFTLAFTAGTMDGTYAEYRLHKNGTMTLSSTDYKIKKIEFTCASGNPIGGFADATGLDKENNRWTGEANKVELTASNAQVRITQMIVYYVEDTRAASGLAWSTGAVEITLGETFTAASLVNPNNIDAAEIVIESDNEDLAKVNAGAVELEENVTGEATITATFAGNETYKPAEFSYTIKVNDPTPMIITNPTTYLNFGSKAQGATIDAKNLEVTLQNVAAATVAITGDGAAAFSATPMSLTGSGTIVVSASSDNQGTFSATLTISDDAGMATAKEISLSLTVTEPVVEETAVSTTSKWVAAEAADLVDGAEVLITGMKDAVTYAMGADRGNNRGAVAATVDGEGVLTPGEGTMAFVLVAQGDGTFALRTSNGKYLYAASSSANQLKTRAAIEDGNAKWTLTATSAIANGSNTNETIRFNGSNNPEIFSCYADETKQADIQLYVPQPTPEPVYTTVRSGLTVGRHYTICQDKKIVAVKGATFWSLNNRDEAGKTAYLEEASLPLTAGAPYIFQATADKLEVIYEGDAVGAPVENGALRGTFSNIMDQAAIDAEATATGSDIYMLKDNELRKANGQTGNTMGAYKAYVVYNALSIGEPAHIQGRRVKTMPMAPQVATGVESIQTSEIRNQKVLINGQLFILRGEKMYNANGQLVK